MSAYLMRYPEVSGELRLSDRMINLVEDGVDLAVRIGHLADSSLVARQVGEMRRIVVASSGYLKARGEPKTPEAIALAHDHPVRRHGRVAGLALRRGRPRYPRRLHAALPDQQRRRRDPVCRAGRRPDPGAGLPGRRRDQGRPAENRAGEIRSNRRCRSTSSIRPRGCCRPRCAVLSIWWSNSATGILADRHSGRRGRPESRDSGFDAARRPGMTITPSSAPRETSRWRARSRRRRP